MTTEAPRDPGRALATGRGPASGLVALAISGSVGVAAAVAGGVFTGAFVALAGFSDAGVVVRYGVPVLTVSVHLAVAVTLGSLVLAACALPPGAGLRRALRAAGVASAAWVALAVGQLVLRYAVISGTAPTDSGFGGQLWSFLTGISLGRDYALVVLTAASTSVATRAIRGPTGAVWTLLLAGVAVAGEANTGHAAGAASHELAISSMFLHLVGAAVWVGGLATLALARGRTGFEPTGHGRGAADARTSDFADVVGRYSVIAGWCFVAVGVSGIINASIRLGGWGNLTTGYGVLLAVKVALMAVLGWFGFVHRELVVRRLHDLRQLRNPRGRTRHEAASVGLDETSRRVRHLFWRLAAVELAVMGAVSGVAVALASSAPPVPQTPSTDPTSAEIVTGHPLPPEPTALRWLTEWRWDLLFAFLSAAGLVTYVRWARRLARRGDHWPLGRTVSWCLGMVVLFWATSGGPAMYGHVLFSAHMIQHMVLAMVVPILLALAAPVTLLLRAVPGRRDGSRGPREWILVVVHSAWGRAFANSIVAAVNFAGSMIVFYYTGLFELALTTYVGHVAMIVHFSLAGYLFVNALVGIDPGPRRLGHPQRLLLLFATMAFHAFFGVALTEGTALLVPEWFGLLGRPWGPSAIVDQQRGGGVAWGIGELPTLALAIVVAVKWARADERDARHRDRRVDREGDAELEEYNAMLSRLAGGNSAEM